MKKLLIIVGAGASVEFNMPSVSDVDQLFKEWGLQQAPLASDPKKSLYSWTRDKLDEYVRQNNGDDRFEIVNFEQLLHTIQMIGVLASDKDHQYYRHALNPFIELESFPDIIGFKGAIAQAKGEDFHKLHSFLVDKLLDYFRLRCRELPVNYQENIQLLRSFLETLKAHFDIGIINLNYDNVILSAMPDLKTGFDTRTGAFDRSKLYDGNWDFCYHMHGSVHFDMKGDTDMEMHKVYWNPDLASQFAQNSSGRNSNTTSEGTRHLTTNIIAGLDKANQLLGEPFGPYFMLTDQLIYAADAILFMGYGFNDNHLNKKFLFTRYDKQKRRKVAVIDWAKDDKDGLSCRRDNWSHNLFGALPTNSREMGRWGYGDICVVKDFRKTNSLEKSSNPKLPLAVWYGGMLEACKHPDTIIAELL